MAGSQRFGFVEGLQGPALAQVLGCPQPPNQPKTPLFPIIATSHAEIKKNSGREIF